MCTDAQELLEELRELHNSAIKLCQEIASMKDAVVKAREGSFGDVTKGLNKISKCIDTADAKLWDAQMLLESEKVNLQKALERKKEDGPDLFPEMKHGEVR